MIIIIIIIIIIINVCGALQEYWGKYWTPSEV